MQKVLYFTKKGYEEKQEEYARLLASRPDAVKELTKAREMGDLSENGYYKGARMKLSSIDRELRELKHILKIGRVKEVNGNGLVDIGTTVTIKDSLGTKTFTIVGTYEADPKKGRISSSSPLGKLLLGKQVGETAIFVINDNKTTYTITAVE